MYASDRLPRPGRRADAPAAARGHRWLSLLESGKVESLREIARMEGLDSRMVNLTTLAPDIVAAILDETLPQAVSLFDLAVDPPALWRISGCELSSTP